MQHYVQYDKTDEAPEDDSGLDVPGFNEKKTPFWISTKKRIKDIEGNKIWLIYGRGKSPKEFLLGCWFIADEVVRQGRRSPFSWAVKGRVGHSFDPEIRLNDLPWFRDFFHSQGSFAFGLSRIADPYVKAFEQLTKQPTKVPITSQKLALVEQGAGYGDPQQNREVEEAAMKCVERDYQRRGWLVTRVHNEKLGYDLRCLKGRQEKHVEVKGIRGTKATFFITANELMHAQDDPLFELDVVTAALSDKQHLAIYRGQEAIDCFVVNPVLYRASLKRGC